MLLQEPAAVAIWEARFILKRDLEAAAIAGLLLPAALCGGLFVTSWLFGYRYDWVPFSYAILVGLLPAVPQVASAMRRYRNQRKRGRSLEIGEDRIIFRDRADERDLDWSAVRSFHLSKASDIPGVTAVLSLYTNDDSCEAFAVADSVDLNALHEVCSRSAQALSDSEARAMIGA